MHHADGCAAERAHRAATEAHGVRTLDTCVALDARLTAAASRRVLPDDLVVAGDQTAALRRFIVARKGDVDKAEEQLRRALEWRKEYGVLAALVRAPLQRAAHRRLTHRARRPSRHGNGWSWCARSCPPIRTSGSARKAFRCRSPRWGARTWLPSVGTSRRRTWCVRALAPLRASQSLVTPSVDAHYGAAAARRRPISWCAPSSTAQLSSRRRHGARVRRLRAGCASGRA